VAERADNKIGIARPGGAHAAANDDPGRDDRAERKSHAAGGDQEDHKPIVLVLNNEGYGTMRKIRDGSFNRISEWNYGKICELVGGGEATVATTKGELDGAIRNALGSKGV
jgi:hypothetical protein